MLNKLLKYDLKWIYKVIVVFYILGIVFALLTRIFSSIDNSLMFTILGKITSGAMISMLISALINGLLRSWVRFVNNVYKDESYLTHTLPVKKSNIYLSKVLMAIIVSFTSMVLALICIFIAYYSKSNMEGLKMFLKLAADSYDTSVFSLILSVTIVLFLEITFIILIGYSAIIIGHRANQGKMAKSAILGIVLYMATSSFTLLIVFIIGLFNKGIMNIINTTEIVNVSAIKSVMYIGMIIYLVYNIFYYVLGKVMFNKGVNVE
jgi:hypothetical protein